MLEWRIHDCLQPSAQRRIVALVLRQLFLSLNLSVLEEFEVFVATGQDITEDGFEAILGQLHVARKVSEGHLRFDHPKLRQVAGRVRILRAERGPEGVDLPQRHGAQLRFQLAAHRQVCSLSKEVFSKINAAVLRLGHIVQVQRGHLEHLACPFGIATGDDGRVHLKEPFIREEFVHGKIQRMANAKYRAERAGSKAQVGLLSEKLHGVALHLNGKRFGIGIAQDLQIRHLQFGHLTASLGGFDDPLGSDGSARCDSLFDCIIGRFSVDDQLQIAQARAVIQCNELVVAKCPHPTLHQNFPSYLRFIAQIHNAFPLHNPRKLFA